MASPVRAKKHLGQHFLVDKNIARKISETLSFEGFEQVLEIGPGTGVLTEFLIQTGKPITAMDVDTESIEYLNATYLQSNLTVVEADFLKADLQERFGNAQLGIIGNFPYNISSQIVFKAIEARGQVLEFAGMFQKEVAQRICQGPGNKSYGILSVLTQAFFETEYLFTVPPGVFNPPPKVDSGVMRMRRKEHFQLPCDEDLFFKVVKTAFNQRRKTLRNSLKSFDLSDKLKEDAIFELRPERLSVSGFVELTQKIAQDGLSDHR
ncbi:16S rRNA (adenine(1518)-N(6)/adenine(1519)-N(6))-dimethyltransferase RsmA [Gilvibacter sediminis]|uniref:16S rRNA (adenine(1518)-N(6)/adenine(1519)-N(6))- dimethyltransferase RsmA n=1 Tax=Gilvibacter sediminis TaxID=379071 RepID=UPI002350B336|nr:16S rRNA (adenine(1518)-N(6)/adenine(1519)-N(6))-dimethyltransferase RsmA [Gilvibacter sediminis]MDC7996564.1 16S rRNA (adenine(1518)-N(6)/adenine(1519)-N(6))-dimethyltransferase RsmA [Gilvibacter sediminis]